MRRNISAIVLMYLLTTVLMALQKPLFLVWYAARATEATSAELWGVVWHGLLLDSTTAAYLTVVPWLMMLVAVWVKIPERVMRPLLTAYFAEEFSLTRKRAAMVTTVVSIVLSTVTFFSLFGIDFFNIFDYVTANVLMPLGAMFTCIMVMWFMKKDFMKDELTNNGVCNRRLTPVILFMLRFITPVLILYIFIKNFI